MKKIIKCIGTLMVATAMIVPFSLGVGAKYCSDIAISNWARDEINYVTDNEYIEPYSDGKYKCGTEITRADVALMIYRYDGSNSTSTNTGYTDVLPGSKYAKAVTWAKDKGIMLGVSSTQFDPFEGIKREDFAVLLLRYAKYKSVNSRRLSANSNALSAFTDVDDVHSYALDAMKWAVTQGIIGGTSPTELSPREHVDRRVAAVLLSRFNLKIERFRWGKENYSFVNSSNNFTDGNYYISSRDLSTLRYYCELNNKTSTYNYILTHIDDSWEGSCFGLATTSLLNKYGKLNFVGNYGKPTDKVLNSLTAVNNTPLRSAINYNHFLQYLVYNSGDYTNVSSAKINSILNALNDGPTVIGMRYTNGTGHAVIAFDYIINPDNTISIIVYDSNYITAPKMLTINSAKTTCTYNGESVSKLRYISDVGMFDKYDLDTYFNDFGAGETNNTSEDSTIEVVRRVDNSAEFIVSGDGEFSITNSRGETLNYSLTEITGNMSLYSENYIIKSEASPADVVLTVADSDRFTVNVISDNISVSLLQEDDYASINGKNIDEIIFDSEGIEVSGAEMNIRIVGQISQNHMVSLSGVASNGLHFRKDEEQITFEGIECINQATAYDCSKTEIDRVISKLNVTPINGVLALISSDASTEISHNSASNSQEEN